MQNEQFGGLRGEVHGAQLARLAPREQQLAREREPSAAARSCSDDGGRTRAQLRRIEVEARRRWGRALGIIPLAEIESTAHQADIVYFGLDIKVP